MVIVTITPQKHELMLQLDVHENEHMKNALEVTVFDARRVLDEFRQPPNRKRSACGSRLLETFFRFQTIRTKCVNF